MNKMRANNKKDANIQLFNSLDIQSLMKYSGIIKILEKKFSKK